MKNKLKISGALYVISAIFMVSTAFFGYKYRVAAKKLDSIEEVLNSNPRLKISFENWRSRAFLKKGVEYIPDYDNPRTLNDKVGYYLNNYFLKSPITKIIGTKYYAKKYIADMVGEEHVVRLFGVWDNPEDIDWDSLPKSFVLKSVRGNFGREVIIVKDKNAADISEITRKLNEFCKVPGMLSIKEKRIIAEELLQDDKENPPVDYKFFCSYGRPLFAYCLSIEDSSGVTDVDEKTCSFYTIPNWEILPVKSNAHQKNKIDRPKHMEKMLEVCEKLSKAFPLVRIDLYAIGDRVLVGEITEDSCGGRCLINPVIWDFKFGEMIPLISKEEIEAMIQKDAEISQKYL